MHIGYIIIYIYIYIHRNLIIFSYTHIINKSGNEETRGFVWMMQGNTVVYSLIFPDEIGGIGVFPMFGMYI